MAPSSRSRPFAFTFHPNGSDEGGGGSSSSTASPWPNKRVIPVNSFAPYDIENDHFKGRMQLVHDTGNEVGLETAEADEELDAPRKGVRLQIQGKFKRDSSKGASNAAGLYVGGMMQAPLKLGWFTQGAVNMCAKYARKKTEGRMHIVIGDKDGKELPQMAFPIAQLFTIVVTPPDEEPPKLGSAELSEVAWQGADEMVHVDTVHTYTFTYKTPFLDCCSWELLNVPGVSPLPLERLLGEIIAAKVMMYDLGIAGSHAAWRKGCVLEWYFTRRPAGSSWLEQEEIEDEQTPLAGADEASDPSEGSHSHGSDVDDLIDDGDEKDDDSHSDTSSSEEPVDEDEEQISRAESQCLEELASWRPRPSALADPALASDVAITIPYYIETVDRRRRRKLRVWYVFQLKDPNIKGEWWTAKAIHELRNVCRKPRPRLRAFRRRRGATRGCQCYGVQTLEQFRQVVSTQLVNDTKLKRSVVAAAKLDTNSNTDAISNPEHPPTPSTVGNLSDLKKAQTGTSDHSAAVSKAPTDASGDRSAAQSEANAQTPSSPPTLNGGEPSTAPPSSSADKSPLDKHQTLAERKAHAAAAAQKIKTKAEAVKTKTREAIKRKVKDARSRSRGPALPPPFFVDVGSSACELAFAHAKEGRATLIHEGMVGTIHYEGRLSEEWMRLSSDGVIRCFMPYDCDKPRLRLSLSQVISVRRREGDGLFLGRFHLWEIHTVMRVMLFCSATEEDAKEWVRALKPAGKDNIPAKAPWPVNVDGAALLTDLTRAKRWRPVKRIVLNDRLLLNANEASQIAPIDYTVAERLLTNVLSFKEPPRLDDAISFLNETCLLKAVDFTNLSEMDLLAFWMNVYHCLLLHGRLVLGKPKSRGELARFYSRVSYLVGTKPLSLKEIERYILRVPIADRVAVTTSGRARYRQLWRICCFCSRRNKGGESQKTSPNASPGLRSPRGGSSGATSPRDKGDKSPNSTDSGPQVQGADRKATGINKKCLPNPPVAAGLEKVAQRMVLIQNPLKRRGTVACFYIGGAPKPVGIPSQDLRVAFCLNRGNMSCLPSIPVFSSVHCKEQMDEVCRKFVSEFVRVSWKDNVPARVTVPQCCRGLKRELANDMLALLLVVWQFMPKDYPQPIRRTKVKFLRYRSEPRDIRNLERFIYSKPEIRISAIQGQGAEFKVVAGAARELVDLAAKMDQDRRSASPPPEREDTDAVQRETSKFRSLADISEEQLKSIYWPDGTLRYTSL